MVYTVLLMLVIGLVFLAVRGIYAVSGPTALGDLRRENRELRDANKVLMELQRRAEADSNAHLEFLTTIAYDVVGRPDIEADLYLTEYKSGRKALSKSYGH